MKGLAKLVLFCLLIIQQDWQAALRVFTFHLPSGSRSSNGCSFGWSRYSCGIRNISLMAPRRSMDRPAERAWLCLQQLCRQEMCIISCPLPWGRWGRTMPSSWSCWRGPSSTATIRLVAYEAAHAYGKRSWKNTPKQLEMPELLHDALSNMLSAPNATRLYTPCVSQVLWTPRCGSELRLIKWKKLIAKVIETCRCMCELPKKNYRQNMLTMRKGALLVLLPVCHS